MRIRTAVLLCALAPCLALCAGGAKQFVDGIAAVIGDEIILQSELEAYILLRLNSLGAPPDSAVQAGMRQRFLDELIDGKVLLVHAKKDSTITVRDEDVERELSAHVAQIMAENRLSAEALEQELRARGSTLQKFKAQLRKGIREQILKRKLQQTFVSAASLTRKEVEAFYREYRDSLPPQGESVRLLMLSVEVRAPDSVRQAAFERIRSIRQRLDNGEDFAETARKFSDDPNAQNGGDLGFVGKGSLSELAFEEKAFSLEPGAVSDPFETRLGFHIVTVKARKNQMVHVQQILVRVEPPAQLIARTEAVLDSVRRSCADPECFAAAVGVYATDAKLKAGGGNLGWFTKLELPPDFVSAFDSLGAGSVSRVIRSANTFSLLMVARHVDSRTLTIEDDLSILEEKARDIYAQKKLIGLVKKWRRNIFIDVRL